MLFANYICKKSGDCLIFLLMLKMLVVPENIFLEKKLKNMGKTLQTLVKSDIIYWCCKYSNFSYDTRGCDTLGCIATQKCVGFLEELAYYLK